jgi:uncharacterized membrane-anchored protein
MAADPPPAATVPANPAPAMPTPALEGPTALSMPASETALGKHRTGPSVQLCLLMARLEETEHGDLAATREWLDRAARAVPDPRYVCKNCGGESLDWHSSCPRCNAFDTLAWRTPIGTMSEGIAADGQAVRVHAQPATTTVPVAEAKEA